MAKHKPCKRRPWGLFVPSDDTAPYGWCTIQRALSPDDDAARRKGGPRFASDFDAAVWAAKKAGGYEIAYWNDLLEVLVIYDFLEERILPSWRPKEMVESILTKFESFAKEITGESCRWRICIPRDAAKKAGLVD